MITDPITEAPKGGHKIQKGNVTANATNQNDSLMPLDMFVLIEHTFFMVIFSDTPENIYKAYISFTKAITTLYHGKHKKDQIRSALILAEDHLTILLEDTENGCEVSIKFAGRALKFLKQYIQMIAEQCVADGVADKKEVKQESSSVTAYTFDWNHDFTELIELIEALLEMECFGNIARGEIKESHLIRVLLNLFGFGHKTLQDYRAARNKLRKKAPKDNGKCKLLPLLLENLEIAWKKSYLDYSTIERNQLKR